MDLRKWRKGKDMIKMYKILKNKEFKKESQIIIISQSLVDSNVEYLDLCVSFGVPVESKKLERNHLWKGQTLHRGFCSS